MTAPVPRTPSQVHDDLDALRRAMARSVAARLLEGAGRCSVVAYHLDPDTAHRPLAHGLCATGQVALALNDSFAIDPGSCGAVRLRLDQLAADARLQVATASLHALGHLHVLEEEQVRSLRQAGALPQTVALAADAGARVALLALSGDKVIVHGHGGVSTLLLPELAEQPAFPSREQEWDSVALVAALGEASSVVQEAADSVRPGLVCGAQPTPPGIAEYAGQVLLADVDSTGCTWLQVEEHLTRSVVVPFPAPIRDLTALTAALQAWRRTAAAVE